MGAANVRAGDCYFWWVDSRSLLMARLAFLIMKTHHLLSFLAATLVGHFPKSQLIRLFCQAESPGKIGTFMKYVQVRRNCGPIQGLAGDWTVIIGAMCLWSSQAAWKEGQVCTCKHLHRENMTQDASLLMDPVSCWLNVEADLVLRCSFLRSITDEC